VGISKADDSESLLTALHEAASYDRRIIVEEGVDAREIEVSVLGNEEPEVSMPGEVVIQGNEFYDYEAKYVEGGMELIVPADLPKETILEIQDSARIAYESVDAAGMARVDFFLERGTDRLLLNEINTIPGFTPTSVYATLWDASGLPYKELLNRLIDLAIQRHA
jgi:D-alanine-D-alanine ligase